MRIVKEIIFILAVLTVGFNFGYGIKAYQDDRTRLQQHHDTIYQQLNKIDIQPIKHSTNGNHRSIK